MTDFERQALADLAILKTEMKLLVGNGQPGRLHLLERRVEKHEAAMQRASGVGAFLGLMLTVVHLSIDYLKFRR